MVEWKKKKNALFSLFQVPGTVSWNQQMSIFRLCFLHILEHTNQVMAAFRNLCEILQWEMLIYLGKWWPILTVFSVWTVICLDFQITSPSFTSRSLFKPGLLTEDFSGSITQFISVRSLAATCCLLFFSLVCAASSPSFKCKIYRSWFTTDSLCLAYV